MLKLGTQTGSMCNYLLSGTNGQPVPVVGMGATILGWTDRSAGTIVNVGPNAKWIEVQSDHAKLVAGSAFSEEQTYEFSPNPKGAISRYTLRRNGAYIRAGEKMRDGQMVRIGERDAYHDPCF